MNELISIFFFLLIIGFLVFIHELGHFLAAKACKMDVFQFSVGMGPILYEKAWKGTRYQIRALPLGGFVELEGELESKSENGFRNKKFYQKFIVLSAGVFMNFVSAIVLLGINLTVVDYTVILPKFADYNFQMVDHQIEGSAVLITDVQEDGPSNGQLFPDENIIKISGETIESEQGFKDLLKKYAGQDGVTFTFIDFDKFETYERKINIAEPDPETGAILRASYANPDNLLDNPVFYLKYKKSLLSPAAQAVDFSVYQLLALGNIITTSAKDGNYEKVAETVGSPVAVGDSVNQIVENDLTELLFFLAAMISLSLAIFNILPIPALDGGHIAVAAYESLTRKRLSDDTVKKINGAGFIFLISLSLLAITKDLIQFNIFSGALDIVKEAFGK